MPAKGHQLLPREVQGLVLAWRPLPHSVWQTCSALCCPCRHHTREGALTPVSAHSACRARPRGSRANPHLCLALVCICRPFRLEARCPHSSHTNSFSPRCLKASCSCSSVRDRKHLAQVGHCRAEGTGQREQGEGRAGLPKSPHPPPPGHPARQKPQTSYGPSV